MVIRFLITPPRRRSWQLSLSDRPLQVLDLEEFAIAIVAHLAPHAAEPEAAPRALGPPVEPPHIIETAPAPSSLATSYASTGGPSARGVQAVRGVVRDRDGLFHGAVRQQHADRAEQLFLCDLVGVVDAAEQRHVVDESPAYPSGLPPQAIRVAPQIAQRPG